MTVEQSAAKAIELLSEWKPVHDEYKRIHAEVVTAIKDPEVSNDEFMRLSASEDALYDLHVNICNEACKLMCDEVFADVCEAECMDWMYSDFDGLMADLADIERGDF